MKIRSEGCDGDNPLHDFIRAIGMWNEPIWLFDEEGWRYLPDPLHQNHFLEMFNKCNEAVLDCKDDDTIKSLKEFRLIVIKLAQTDLLYRNNKQTELTDYEWDVLNNKMERMSVDLGFVKDPFFEQQHKAD